MSLWNLMLVRFEPLPIFEGETSFSEDFLPEEGRQCPRTSAMPTTKEAADLGHSVHGGE